MSASLLEIAISGAVDTDAAIAPPCTTHPGWPPQVPSPGGSSQEAKLSRARVLPHPEICRAKALGSADYADCLVEHPWECPYARSFGLGFLCQHPERHEIVRRTAWHD